MNKLGLIKFCNLSLELYFVDYTDSSLRGRIADSPKQSKKISQPNLARFVVQKIGFKDAVVPSADFLLESELRGSPPKSEKVAAFGEHNLNIWGERRREVQPFLRKEKGEIDDKGFSESNLDFANYAKVAGYTL